MEVAEHYRTRCLRSPEDFNVIINALPEWLSDLSERGSGDDATMVLAARFQ